MSANHSLSFRGERIRRKWFCRGMLSAAASDMIYACEVEYRILLGINLSRDALVVIPSSSSSPICLFCTTDLREKRWIRLSREGIQHVALRRFMIAYELMYEHNLLPILLPLTNPISTQLPRPEPYRPENVVCELGGVSTLYHDVPHARLGYFQG